MAGQYYGIKDGGQLGFSASGWHLVGTTPTDELPNTVIDHGEDGDYMNSTRKSTGKRKSITETWKPDSDDTTAPEVTIGDVDGTTCVESASLACSASDRPTLTITGHIHQSVQTGGGHAGDTFAYQFKFPAGAFGCVNPFGGGVANVADDEIQSSTESVKIDHVDEPGRTGEMVVGYSRGGTVDAQFEAVADASVTVADLTDWTIKSSSRPQTNSGLVKLNVSGTKYFTTKG